MGLNLQLADLTDPDVGVLFIGESHTHSEAFQAMKDQFVKLKKMGFTCLGVEQQRTPANISLFKALTEIARKNPEKGAQIFTNALKASNPYEKLRLGVTQATAEMLMAAGEVGLDLVPIGRGARSLPGMIMANGMMHHNVEALIKAGQKPIVMVGQRHLIDSEMATVPDLFDGVKTQTIVLGGNEQHRAFDEGIAKGRFPLEAYADVTGRRTEAFVIRSKTDGTLFVHLPSDTKMDDEQLAKFLADSFSPEKGGLNRGSADYQQESFWKKQLEANRNRTAESFPAHEEIPLAQPVVELPKVPAISLTQGEPIKNPAVPNQPAPAPSSAPTATQNETTPAVTPSVPIAELSVWGKVMRTVSGASGTVLGAWGAVSSTAATIKNVRDGHYGEATASGSQAATAGASTIASTMQVSSTVEKAVVSGAARALGKEAGEAAVKTAVERLPLIGAVVNFGETVVKLGQATGDLLHGHVIDAKSKAAQATVLAVGGTVNVVTSLTSLVDGPAGIAAGTAAGVSTSIVANKIQQNRDQGITNDRSSFFGMISDGFAGSATDLKNTVGNLVDKGAAAFHNLFSFGSSSTQSNQSRTSTSATITAPQQSHAVAAGGRGGA